MLILAVTVIAFGCAELTGRQASTTVDDAQITAKVKTKLAAEQIGTLTRVDVDTVRGTVYLNGTVQRAELKSRATDLARGVDGVQKVVNNLQVSG
jgi:osmotically-inducible protein OsmY